MCARVPVTVPLQSNPFFFRKINELSTHTGPAHWHSPAALCVVIALPEGVGSSFFLPVAKVPPIGLAAERSSAYNV